MSSLPNEFTNHPYSSLSKEAAVEGLSENILNSSNEELSRPLSHPGMEPMGPKKQKLISDQDLLPEVPFRDKLREGLS